MFSCNICGREYSYKCGLYRHKREDKICKRIYKLQTKCSKFKDALRSVMERKEELSNKAQSLTEDNLKLQKENKELQNENRELQKENKELIDDRNLLYHQLEMEKVKTSTNDKKDKMIEELVKQNKVSTNNTIINNNNNTVIINDFRIKSADEFDESKKEELIECIRNKEVSYVYQWLLELLYWTKPPNISIRDQSRKKVMILRENKWIQENVDILVHRMFYRTIKPIVMNCIEEQIDEYEELIKEPENKNNEEMRDELMIWEEIHNLWSRYDHKRLNQPFLQTVSNLQNHNKLLNIN